MRTATHRLTPGATPASEGQWLTGGLGSLGAGSLSTLTVVREGTAPSHGSTEGHGNGGRCQEVPVAVPHHEVRGTRR